MTDAPSPLDVTIGDVTLQAPPDRTTHIGRSEGQDLTIDDGRVSRAHATVAVVDGRWRISDAGSSRGLWLDDVRVDHVDLPAAGTIRLADPSDGPIVIVSDPSPVPELPAVDVESGQSTVLGDPSLLRVRLGDVEHVFTPDDSPVQIGRDAGCDVPIDVQAVSRVHCTLEWRDDTWYLRDADSSGGTFLDGRRIRKPIDASGAFSVFLAGEAEGVEVRILAPGERPEVSAKSIPVIAAAVIAVVALAVGAFIFFGPDDDGGGANTAAELDALKVATVYIELQDETGGPLGSGSGTVVDDDLVLTNAHVAAMDAPGQRLGELPAGRRDPVEMFDRIVLGLSLEPGGPATPRFVAEVVAADGYLDLAVLRVVSDLDGNPVESLGIEPVAISPDIVASGEAVDAFGFPGIADSDEVTLTRGIVSGTQSTSLIEGPDWYTTDVVVNPGNSGGLAAIDGQLVGVPTRAGSDIGGALNLLRPGYLAGPLLDAARNGEEYDPFEHYLQEPSGSESMELRLTDGDDCDAATADLGRSLVLSSTDIDAGQLVSVYHGAVFPDSPDVELFDLEVLPWPADEQCLVVPSNVRAIDQGAEMVVVDVWIGPNVDTNVVPLAIIAG